MTDHIHPAEAIEIANRESFIIGPGYHAVTRESENGRLELRLIRKATDGVEHAHCMWATRDMSVPTFSVLCRSLWAQLQRLHEDDVRKERECVTISAADVGDVSDVLGGSLTGTAAETIESDD